MGGTAPAAVEAREPKARAPRPAARARAGTAKDPGCGGGALLPARVADGLGGVAEDEGDGGGEERGPVGDRGAGSHAVPGRESSAARGWIGGWN